jgi:hypothetical protein
VSQNNVIELNGKQYDAITGAFLGESRIKATPDKRTPTQHRGRAVDGFMRNRATGLAPTVVKPNAAPKTVAAPVITGGKATAAGKRMDIQRSVKHAKAHQPERAKTLMRHIVAKPKTQIKPAIKTTAPSEVMAKPSGTIAKQLEKKMSVTQVNPIRLARSRQVAKSHHIRRYNQAHAKQQPAPSTATVQPQPVQRPVQYVARPAAHQASNAAESSNTIRHAAIQQPAKQNAADIFEAALAHANSHQEPLQRNSGHRAARKRRFASIAAGFGAFLVIGGFIAYLNMPTIELRVASIQAGFHAEMPGYRPTGYALDGGVKSSEGKIEMTFRSGDSSYQITQEVSDWNSATLLDQNTEQRGTPNQTIQSKGRIIYIYDDASATWVDSGIRYEINGDAALDSNELVSLATSM